MSKKKVLCLVPKNKKFLSVKELSNKTGIHIDVKKDGVNSYEALKKGGYDLVISSMFAKNLNGYELISKIKKDKLACGVILTMEDEKEIIRDDLTKGRILSFVKKVNCETDISKQINEYFNKKNASGMKSKSSLRKNESDIEQSILKKTKKLNRLENKLNKINNELDQAKESLEKNKEYLLDSERLISIGRMTASIVHEINNPLSAITSLASAISLKCKNVKNMEKYNEMLMENYERLKSLINNILSFANPNIKKKEEVDINEAIDDILSFYAHEIKKNNISLKKKFGNYLQHVSIPKIRIQQVVLNILKNAVSAMDSAKGTITIKTSMKNDFVVVEIKDTGKGIPKSEVENIFKPFYSTKSAKEGAGLGLFICKEILKNYNGEIEIKSTLNKGTKVTIRLPISKIEKDR